MVDKRKAAALFVLFMILAAAAIIVVIRRVRVKTYSYDTVDAVFRNPMMGFAPNADYFDAVGDNTLVYMDVTWRELEPEEGVFDFAGIEEENFWIHGVRREKGLFSGSYAMNHPMGSI